MWQRFTERARRVVFFAQEEAQKFGEGYVSTEHLLLGIVREDDSTAIQALTTLGHSRETVREEVEKLLPQGDTRPNQDMSLTPRAKRVIDLSYHEARMMSNDYIGTEHLLLGLISEHDGIAGRVLTNLGITLDDARAKVIKIQGGENRPKMDVYEPEQAASYVRPNQSQSHDWSKYPLVSELFFALLNDSDDAIEERLEELKQDRKDLKSEIARLLLNQ